MEDDTQSFNPGAYWEGRHKEFLNDNRNVGERGLTSAQNYELIAAKAAIVGHTLGKLGLQRGADILDAGCGAGVFTSLLANSGFTMYGVDVSQTAIATARANVDVSFEIGPLSKRVFGRRFDAVLCLDVLFHVVDEAEWRKSLESLFESVKPGGFLVIIEYFPVASTKAATHCRWRSLADYRACLPEAKWAENFSFTYPYRNEEKTLFVLQRPDPKDESLPVPISFDAEKDQRARKLRAAGVRLTGTDVPQEPFICEGGPVNIRDTEIGPWNTIGNQSYINSGFIRSAVEIGRYCSIGRNVTIGTGTHDVDALSTSPVLGSSRNIVKYADPERRKSVVIGHDVWIGDDTIVMTGVTVGTGAVIAAGSVVTKDVAPYAVVGGNYAKPIGRQRRFEPEICEGLLASKWWELPLDALRLAPHSSPREFLAWLENVGSQLRREPFLARARRV